MGRLGVEMSRPEDGGPRATKMTAVATPLLAPAVILALPMELTSYPFSEPSSDVCN